MAGSELESLEKGIRAGEEALLSAALAEVHELNERCLVCLQKLAMEQPDDFPAFLGRLRLQFRKLDGGAILAIARQPFLLVDFGFGKPKVTRGLLTGGPMPLRFPSPRRTFPPAEATALARGALLLAKSVCRHHPAHAGFLLGLDPLLQQTIAELRLPELERVAEEHPEHLHLRWDNRADVWECLLSAAASTDPDAWHQFRMYGMQLVAGELNLKRRP